MGFLGELPLSIALNNSFGPIHDLLSIFNKHFLYEDRICGITVNFIPNIDKFKRAFAMQDAILVQINGDDEDSL